MSELRCNNIRDGFLQSHAPLTKEVCTLLTHTTNSALSILRPNVGMNMPLHHVEWNSVLIFETADVLTVQIMTTWIPLYYLRMELKLLLILRKPYRYWLVTLQGWDSFPLPEAISLLIWTDRQTSNHSDTQRPHYCTTKSNNVWSFGTLPKLF